MFIACPHCRYLVATDPRTQAPPARCSRCGGVLVESAAPAESNAASSAPGQSFASLLRPDSSSTSQAEVAAPHADDASSGSNADVVPASTPDDESSSDAAEEAVTAHVADDSPRDAAQDSPSPVADEAASPVVSANQELAGAVVAVQRTTPRAPGFLRRGAAPSTASRGLPRWQWLSVVVLVIALLLQMLIADRARLATDAGWRPIVLALCNALGCSVPPWREPQAFVMLDRDVRPLVGAPGVLQARATFRNDARWAQPWPTLLVTLKDADGRSLGARAIVPSEYLRGTANRELAPGQSAQVSVRIREPSASVVAFSFDFR